MILLAAFLSCLTAFLSFLAADAMRRHSARLGFTDQPNHRSSHTTSTARAGGVGFALVVPMAIACGTVLYPPPDPTAQSAVLIGALALALIGLADDRWALPPLIRLLAHCAAAIGVTSTGVVIREIPLPWGAAYELGMLAVPATVVWMVALTNVYNFMDGIDGLAASQGIVAASAIGALAACTGRPDVALAMGVLAAGICGFLILNWSPARIFMGDVGSTFLGFMFGAWAAMSSGSHGASIPFFAWAAVLSPFLLDATWTLGRRALRGEQLYQPHRTHLYQQLVSSGWSHARTTLLYTTIGVWASALTLVHYCLQVLPVSIYLPALALPLGIPFVAVAAALRRRAS
jgi:UDP-N-acetylmuramyl pentapeptide phosphotransferase/UDP-N-acetylglucosamine-1-phosphate transferase